MLQVTMQQNMLGNMRNSNERTKSEICLTSTMQFIIDIHAIAYHMDKNKHNN